MAITQRRLTLEQFLSLPEEKPALEYCDGMVTQKVSPKAWHGALQGEIVELINRLARPERLARAFPETRATFAGASFVPDVVVYRSERLPRNPDGSLADDLFIAPDIAFEIVSPGQTVVSQVSRCRWYVANGVKIAVFVNSRDRSLTVVRPGAPDRVVRGADRIDFSDVVPGLSLAADELFAALRAD